ncbi:DUF1835 domain-containing protein [Fundidesulfovibrio terrae]|uniref:DUF1835 domain-containing protein n=1 Tax=Fundidesulfovibrio terrae TaxID=2922866 RepID=UPI001FAF67D8|nr:DUF1835 domain-containing protein [Fundidesulfovibrio terrae]
MLHITCGDFAAEELRRAGMADEVLPWRDVLHEGPVPSDVTGRELREIRADFIASCGWGDYEEVLGSLDERDRLVERSAADGAVLWFEADLFDQLQMLEVVSLLRGLGVAPGSILAFRGAGFSGLDSEGLLKALEPLDAATMRAADEAWRAFTSPDPSGLERFVAEGVEGLPYVAEAVGRLLEEYPGVGDGLSRLERVMLEAASSGPVSGAALFKAVSRQEERPFFGDWSCWLMASRLMSGPAPLLAGDEGNFPDRMVRLTKAGERTLSGGSDWMRTGGRGRWIGGVRLDQAQDWRYDRNAATLARLDGRGARQ